MPPESSKSKRKLLINGLLALPLLAAVVALVWITQPLLIPVRDVNVPTVSPERLEAHVRHIVDGCYPRGLTDIENLDCAAAYIREEFEQTRGNVSEQVFTYNGETYRNVIVEFGPETPERIIVGAHYDAYEMAPGADDNASAVAGLLELAYLLDGQDLPLRVELVAYTLEEYGYVGSQQHANLANLRGESVRAMISMDMIGYFTDEPNSQDIPWAILRPFYPSTGDGIAIAGPLDQGRLVRTIKRAMQSASPLPVYSINVPRSVKEITRSDQRSYWKAGYPAAVLVTDTAYLRNKAYHSLGDTPDTLDYARMAMVMQGVFAAVGTLAE